MRIPSLPADFAHARPCKPFCEKYLTLPLFGCGLLSPFGMLCRGFILPECSKPCLFLFLRNLFCLIDAAEGKLAAFVSAVIVKLLFAHVLTSVWAKRKAPLFGAPGCGLFARFFLVPISFSVFGFALQASKLHNKDFCRWS